MEDDIFDAPDQSVQIDPEKDYVAELVGDGKKFKDVSGLARGKYEADLTIEQLKKKLDELNQELGTRTSMKDFMDQMKALQSPANAQTPAPILPDQVAPTGLDDSTLAAKLDELLSQREAQKSRETNLQKVTRVMKDNFGDDANSVIAQKAQALGMSANALKALAVDSPSAFFSLVGAQEQREVNAPFPAPRQQVNTGNGQSFSPVRNAAFYEKMKQTNPKQYFDNKTTVEMIKDRKALGDRW